MSSMDKNISPAVIKRLPRYYRYLGALKAKILRGSHPKS